MVFDQIQQPVKQLHQAAGWPGRLYTDTYAGEDPDTGRDIWNEDETGVPITIRIEWQQRPNVESSPAGEEVVGDVTVIVDPDEHSDNPEYDITISDGEGTNERPSEIQDMDSGSRYRVLRIQDEHSGVVRLYCETVS